MRTFDTSGFGLYDGVLYVVGIPCIRKTSNFLFSLFSCFFILFPEKVEKVRKSPVPHFSDYFFSESQK